MSSRPPLVVAILHSHAEDIDYQLYGAAYGIEMQVDGDWNAEAILLVPHDHLRKMISSTGVISEDAAIVSAGATDIPVSDSGSPIVPPIQQAKSDWVLIGDPRRKDTNELIARKLKATLDNGYRAIICFTDTTQEHIATRISGLASIDCSRIVVALVQSNATQANVAVPFAQFVRSQLKARGASGDPRVIVAGIISGDSAKDIVGMEGIDGVFLMDNQYDDWGLVLEILEAVGERASCERTA